MSEDQSNLEREEIQSKAARATTESRPTPSQRGLDLNLRKWPFASPNPLTQPTPSKIESESLLKQLLKLLKHDSTPTTRTQAAQDSLDQRESDRLRTGGAKREVPGERMVKLPEIKTN